MTTFDDRERAFETKFARDDDMIFRATARRNRLVGRWAAEKLGLSAEEADAYSKAVVAADLEEAGDEDVIRKVMGDFAAGQIDVSEAELRAMLAEKAAEARQQLMDEG